MPIVLIIIGVVVLIGGLVYVATDFDAEWPLWSSILVSFSFIIGGAIWAANIEEDECHRAGGHMVGTGQYYAITTMAGKVPITTIHEVTECRIPTPSN